MHEQDQSSRLQDGELAWDEHGRLRVLRTIVAISILSTAIHYTHNFVAVSSYPGPGGSFYTVVRVAIVIAWPSLTAIGLIGYRRYRERRFQEAHVCLVVYSLTGLATFGHFIYGNPAIPAFFYATLFTDGLTGLAVLVFAARSVLTIDQRRQGAGA